MTTSPASLECSNNCCRKSHYHAIHSLCMNYTALFKFSAGTAAISSSICYLQLIHKAKNNTTQVYDSRGIARNFFTKRGGGGPTHPPFMYARWCICMYACIYIHIQNVNILGRGGRRGFKPPLAVPLYDWNLSMVIPPTAASQLRAPLDQQNIMMRQNRLSSS